MKWLLSFQYNQCCSENIAALIRILFHGDWCFQIQGKKVRLEKGMIAGFNVRKIYSAVERVDGCEYCLEIIMVPLKGRMAGTNFV